MSSRVAAQAGAALPRPTAVFGSRRSPGRSPRLAANFLIMPYFAARHGRMGGTKPRFAAWRRKSPWRAKREHPFEKRERREKKTVDPARFCAWFAAPGDSLILSMVLFRVAALKAQAGLASTGLLGRAPGPAFWGIPVCLRLEAPGLCFAPRFAAALFCFFSGFSSFSVFSSARPRMAWGWFLSRRRRRLFAAGLFPGGAPRGESGEATSLVQWRGDGLLFPSR